MWQSKSALSKVFLINHPSRFLFSVFQLNLYPMRENNWYFGGSKLWVVLGILSVGSDNDVRELDSSLRQMKTDSERFKLLTRFKV